MTPTPTLRIKLRKLLDERAPDAGSENDTRFTDEELDELLSDSSSIYGAASTGWTMKAAMLQRELGKIESYAVGAETYKVTNLTTAINAALKMAETYRKMATSGLGSRVVRFTPPEVL